MFFVVLSEINEVTVVKELAYTKDLMSVNSFSPFLLCLQ